MNNAVTTKAAQVVECLPVIEKKFKFVDRQT
jgi:hypothetical protein